MKTAKQAEAEAREQRFAEQRRAAGLCTRSVTYGFNCRRACRLRYGHAGRCA